MYKRAANVRSTSAEFPSSTYFCAPVLPIIWPSFRVPLPALLLMHPSLVKHRCLLASGVPALVISQIVVGSVTAALVLVHANWFSISCTLSCLSDTLHGRLSSFRDLCLTPC